MSRRHASRKCSRSSRQLAVNLRIQLPSSDFSVITVRTPGDSADDTRVFRKLWEHVLMFAYAHQVEPVTVLADLVLVAAAANTPLLVTRVIFPSHSVFFSISVSAVSVALYPDSPLSARSQPPHLGSFMVDVMRSSVPERRSHPSFQ
jgi:hypothetical protein